MPWQRRKKIAYRTKYDLAVEMLEWAIESGLPKGIVLADSWYGMGPFIKELKRLKLDYVLEIKSDRKIRRPGKEAKRTPSGKLAKKQYELMSVAAFFASMKVFARCGFARDLETGKEEKVLYDLKIATARFNAFAGQHRVVASIDVRTQSVKY